MTNRNKRLILLTVAWVVWGTIVWHMAQHEPRAIAAGFFAIVATVAVAKILYAWYYEGKET